MTSYRLRPCIKRQFRFFRVAITIGVLLLARPLAIHSRESSALGTSTAKDQGSAQSPEAERSLSAALTRDFVDLVGYVAWPITIIAIFVVLKPQVIKIVESIHRRIDDPRNKIGIGTEGLTIEPQVNAVDSRLESLQISQDQLKALLLALAPESMTTNVADSPASRNEISPNLLRLAQDYLDTNKIRDYWGRVQEKNHYAQEMASIVIRENVSRDRLAQSDNEGLIAALATAVNTLPQQGDLASLLTAASHTKTPHVKYRIVLAFVALIQKSLLKPDDYARVEDILKAFSRGADASLLKRIEGTRELMRQAIRI